MKIILLFGGLLLLFGCSSAPRATVNGVQITQYWRVLQAAADAEATPMRTSGSVGNLHLPGQKLQTSAPPISIRRCRDAQKTDCSSGIVSIELALQLMSAFEGGVVVEHQVLTTTAPYYERVFGSGGSYTTITMGDSGDQGGIRDRWADSGTQRLPYGKVVRVAARDEVALFLCAEPSHALGGTPLCPAHTEITLSN